MNDMHVEVVFLAPMRVASAYGFGTNPEEQAWKKLEAFAKEKNMLNDRDLHPVFGFNNPNPSPPYPNYGYEFWIKVGADAEPSGDIRIIEFMGGAYAKTRCHAQGDPAKNIPGSWHALAEWCKTNKYRFGHHQPLESVVSGQNTPNDLVLDLYCPIVEKD